MRASSARRSLFVAIALGIACASHARAGAAAASDNETGNTQPAASKPAATPKTLAAVHVVGHYANGVGTSDAASQGVVLGSLLQDIPLLRPGEVLETVPGLVVTQHSGEGKANQYFLRGYNLDHGTDFATSVDGVPVNMPTHAHGQGYTDLNFLIPELVQEIDYRKGPYFAQNGDFSSAGSADVRYRNSLPRGIADLTFGSFDYRRLLLADSVPVSHLGHGDRQDDGPILLGALELVGNDGPDRRDPERLRKFNSLLRLSDGDATNGWSADAMGYRARWNSTDQVPQELIDSGELCRFCALDPSDGGETARDVLSAEWHAHDDSGYTRASAYAGHYSLRLFSDFTYFELRPQTGDQFEQAEARNLFGGQFARGWRHGLFGHDSTTEAGVQLRHDDIHVGLFNSQARVPFETVSDNLVRETEAGIYLQNATTWAPWLRSLVGVRDDNVRMDLDSQTIADNSGHAAQGRVSPKLALILGPWAKTEFFVDIGNGFHSNDARGAIYRIDPTTGGPYSQVPALVGSFGKEVGLRSEIVPGLQSSLALWSLDSASELVYAADSATGSFEPNGASRRHGLEWNNHYALNRHLLFDADLAWTHARYAHANDNGDVGDRIPNAVPKVASFGLAARDLGPWSGDIKLRYVGRYPLSQDGSLTAPSSVVTNIRIERRLGESIAIRIDGLNIFNRKYDDIAYEQDYRVSPTAPIVADGITVHPGDPREVRVTLRMKF
ncbi:MAG TPA: TonB-dependent receptor [Xanthomonadaceae bacterium]|jgi:hypothetical protein